MKALFGLALAGFWLAAMIWVSDALLKKFYPENSGPSDPPAPGAGPDEGTDLDHPSKDLGWAKGGNAFDNGLF